MTEDPNNTPNPTPAPEPTPSPTPDAEQAARYDAIRENLGKEDEAPPPTPPGGKVVPITALEGATRSREAAEAKYHQLVESVKLLGGDVTDEGDLIPPAQAEPPPTAAPGPQPSVPDPLTGLRDYAANVLGVEPEGFIRAVGPVLEAAVAPLYASNTQTNLTARMVGQSLTDPDNFPVYSESLYKFLAEAPPDIRYQIVNSDKHFAMAVDMAKVRHLKELTAPRENRGEVVGRFTGDAGRFTEGAAPSAREGPTHDLTPEVDRMATLYGLTPEQKARVAAKKARREGRGEDGY